MDRPLKYLIVAAMFSALAFVAYGQETTAYPYRLVYEYSPDLPDGIAFHATFSMINHTIVESTRFDSAAWVSREMRLDDVAAQNFLSRALAAIKLIETDVNRELATHACRFAGDSISKDEKYTAMQATYDIQTRVYNRHYAQFKADLPAHVAAELQRWMDEQKLVIGHYEIDFEQADKQTGRDSTDTLAMLCARPTIRKPLG